MDAALYLMTFSGKADFGGGAIFIGNGKILGVDVGNLRYKGSYTEQAGRIKIAVTMSAPTGGQLVTGAQLPAGSQLQLSGDWPVDFDNGQPQQVMVSGQPVQVIFEKIDNI